MSNLLEWDAAQQIGEKVLDAIDRLTDVDAIAPGAEAKWKFEVDGIEYECLIRVSSRRSPSLSPEEGG